MPNFKKLAKLYDHHAILALQEFVRKNSVYDPKTIEKGAPYGKGVKSALDYVAELGHSMGAKVDLCDGHATELTFGEEGPIIGIYAHSDVVPISGSWKYPPFSAKIDGEGKSRRMWGRGTSDDKGPLIAALYSCKLLQDNGLLDGYRVRLVAGGDEERGSSCLEYYFHELKKEPSVYGFTPDAEFPLIYAEKGIAHFNAVNKVDLRPIVAIDGGVVVNAVCDKVVVTWPIDRKFQSHFLEKKIPGDINLAGDIMIVSFKGKSAHASTPEVGVNAMLLAFKTLGEFYKIEVLQNLANVLADPFGAGFGGQNTSKELGKATYSYGLVNYASGKLCFSVDFRFGESANPDELIEKFKAKTGMEIEMHGKSKVLLFDKKSPLVSTLMKSYKRMTHKFFDKPLAIGGGTYAKEAPNCVAYGSAFKDHPGDIHSPNEYIYIDDFLAQIAIYADAIYSLGQVAK